MGGFSVRDSDGLLLLCEVQEAAQWVGGWVERTLISPVPVMWSAWQCVLMAYLSFRPSCSISARSRSTCGWHPRAFIQEERQAAGGAGGFLGPVFSDMKFPSGLMLLSGWAKMLFF